MYTIFEPWSNKTYFIIRKGYYVNKTKRDTNTMLIQLQKRKQKLPNQFQWHIKFLQCPDYLSSCVYRTKLHYSHVSCLHRRIYLILSKPVFFNYSLFWFKEPNFLGFVLLKSNIYLTLERMKISMYLYCPKAVKMADL